MSPELPSGSYFAGMEKDTLGARVNAGAPKGLDATGEIGSRVEKVTSRETMKRLAGALIGEYQITPASAKDLLLSKGLFLAEFKKRGLFSERDEAFNPEGAVEDILREVAFERGLK